MANPDPLIQMKAQFTAEWQSGKRPRLEDYFVQAPEIHRRALLRELLARELQERGRRGEQPSPGEYLNRFPQNAEDIQAVFLRQSSSSGVSSGASPGKLNLTATEGPHKGEVFSFLGHDVFLVGRSRHAHLQLRDSYFSRIHFMVEMNPPQCRLTDMGSHNGTQVNGQRVQTADLKNGDVIKAGHTSLLVSLPEPPPSASVEDEDMLEAQTMTLGAVAAEAAGVPRGAPTPPSATAPMTPTLMSPASPPPGPSPAAKPSVAPDLAQIGSYDIVRELGRGGMGVVYLAKSQKDGALVAVKTIIPAVAGNQTQVERFLREARILCQLQHPNIVCFREVGESAGRLFFAMDFVEGTDAAALLKEQGSLPIRTAARMTCQLLSALEFAHGKGFVHRDLKPANMLVTEIEGKKTVKLLDFGLARVYQESRLSGLTMQGDLGGTVPFMPPEQITQFRQVKPAADQYSAAATLYNLLTSKYVFDFKGATAQPFLVVLHEQPVPIRDRRPEVPEELAQIIHRALAKEPGDRFPDVKSFRTALIPFAR